MLTKTLTAWIAKKYKHSVIHHAALKKVEKSALICQVFPYLFYMQLYFVIVQGVDVKIA